MTTKRKRTCKGKTKTGKPCGAVPLKPGTVIEGVTVKGKHCRTHDPDLPDSARLQGPQPGSGRPRVPRPTEVAAELVQRHIYRIFRPHFRALGLELNDDGTVTELDYGAVVTATFEGEVHASTVEDLAAQIKAAEHLLDRVSGRPAQAIQHSGPDGGPVELGLDFTVAIEDPETRKRAHDLVEQLARPPRHRPGGESES
jgi:hypothetical protein